MYTGERPRFGQMVVVDGRLRHWSPELEPPPAAPGLGGFFGDLGNFAKKTIRYTGASTIGVFMPAGARAKAFGLSTRESKQFEIEGKVVRGVAAAVVTAGIGMKIAAAAKAASAAKAAAAAQAAAAAKGTAVAGVKMGSMSLMPVAGTKGAIMGAATFGGKTAIATTAASSAAGTTAAVAAPLAAKAGGMSLLTKVGLAIGGVTVAQKVFAKKPIPVGGEVLAGYAMATGEPVSPLPSIGDAWDFGKDIADKIKDYVVPAQPPVVAGQPYAPEQSGQAPQEAGANWLLIAAAVGVGVFMLGGSRK